MFDILSWKFPIGRLFGVTIRVHILFLIVAIPLVLRFCIKDVYPGTWIDALFLSAIAFVSILLHEFGHVFGARIVGGEADEVVMWPLGGVAEISYLPAHPWAHFVNAVGGPLVNLALCIVSALALTFCFEQSIRPAFNFFTWYPFRSGAGYSLSLWDGSPLATDSLATMAVVWVFYVNWFLLVFNVALVGIPYDGGNIARSILWPYVGFHQATMYMITSGFVISVLMLMAMFFFDQASLLGCLAIYTFLMCRREWLMLESRGEDSLFGYDFSAGYTSLEKDMPTHTPRKKTNFIQRYIQRRNARKAHREQEEQVAEERRMDQLLEKIQQHGKGSLTDEENRFLKRVSDRYRNRN